MKEIIDRIRKRAIRALGGVPAKSINSSNVVRHCAEEMERAWPVSDDMQDRIKSNIIDLAGVFAAQGHSKTRANYVMSLFSELARFEPLGPLTGEEHEWRDVSECGGSPFYQNKRCSRVFREGHDNSTAYDIEGRIFREPDGECFTSRDSWVNVTFPYVPKQEYVDVDWEGNVISLEKEE